MAKIVLIDDEEVFLKGISFFLNTNNHEVFTFNNGKDALDQILKMHDENKKIDLIITDFVMPGLNGFELIKNLSEKKINIPILITTGFYDEQDIGLQNYKMRIDVINKPFDRKTLLEKVELILKESKNL